MQIPQTYTDIHRDNHNYAYNEWAKTKRIALTRAYTQTHTDVYRFPQRNTKDKNRKTLKEIYIDTLIRAQGGSNIDKYTRDIHRHTDIKGIHTYRKIHIVHNCTPEIQVPHRHFK